MIGGLKLISKERVSENSNYYHYVFAADTAVENKVLECLKDKISLLWSIRSAKDETPIDFTDTNVF